MQNTKQEEDLQGSQNKDAFVFYFMVQLLLPPSSPIQTEHRIRIVTCLLNTRAKSGEQLFLKQKTSGSAEKLIWPSKHYQVPAITLFPLRKSMACTVCHSGVLDHKLTMLTVRFRLGRDLMPRSLFPPLHLLWPFKSGSCIAANHSASIFPNRNPMTPGNLCLILALPKIAVRPQIWHDNIQSQRKAKWCLRGFLVMGLHC